MFALAEHLESSEPKVDVSPVGGTWRFVSGLVTEIPNPGRFLVDVDGCKRIFRRAASCLLEPACGDRVLVASVETEAYVLAVLERTEYGPAALSVGAAASHLVIHGAHISIAAEREVALEAASVVARTRRFTLLADAMGFVGKVLTQAVDRWRVSAEATEIVSRDIATKALRRVAIVEETDSLEAGAVVQNIATATVTSANAAVIAAKEDLRLDGERVTVG